MTTTATIMKKLAQRMAESIQTPDARHREAMVTDMLLGVIRTGEYLVRMLVDFIRDACNNSNHLGHSVKPMKI